ncbi:MAG: nitronate monooxygenase [Thermoleophilia bacterium]|nr:nitronate monooxygenase [Thermoleophilia bacterium]
MSVRTPLCDTLGIDAPVVLAPISRGAALAAAVSNAGGLGQFQGSWLSPDGLRETIREARALTARPFAVNLVLEWPQHERLAVLLEEGVRLVSFHWGDPAPYVPAVHAAGGLVLSTVASAEEARQAVAAGVDAVVAQGWEAGGHVRGEVSTLALVPAVVDGVSPVPVIAAGGIADGRTLAAALALGAQAGWVGTRFVATVEAPVHEDYKRRLVGAVETDTLLSTLFDVGWRGAPSRALVNSTVRRWREAGCPPDGSRPGEGEVVARAAEGYEVVRYAADDPLAGMAGEIEAMATYAGQGVALVRDVVPAAAVVRGLVEEARRVLADLAS